MLQRLSLLIYPTWMQL